VLTNVEMVQNIPGMQNTASVPVPWLNSLIGAADTAIKSYLGRDIELQAYVELYSGNNDRDIVIRQYPILVSQTTIAAASNGAVLPQATINVASTAGFHPGTAGNPNATPPTIGIQTGPSTSTFVTYTGTTPTSFTGCTGGTGTLTSTANQNMVYSPVVFFDQGAFSGQAPNSFGPNTQLILGTQYMVNVDSGGKVSNRGTLRRVGAFNLGFIGFYPENMYSGKLGASRQPFWPRSDGGIKVAYSAGYPNGKVPWDIQYAAGMLVVQMTRIQPLGANASSENLGNYTYSILDDSDNPEMGTIRRILARYREPAFGWP
jgi:hypothetical protein